MCLQGTSRDRLVALLVSMHREGGVGLSVGFSHCGGCYYHPNNAPVHGTAPGAAARRYAPLTCFTRTRTKRRWGCQGLAEETAAIVEACCIPMHDLHLHGMDLTEPIGEAIFSSATRALNHLVGTIGAGPLGLCIKDIRMPRDAVHRLAQVIEVCRPSCKRLSLKDFKTVDVMVTRSLSTGARESTTRNSTALDCKIMCAMAPEQAVQGGKGCCVAGRKEGDTEDAACPLEYLQVMGMHMPCNYGQVRGERERERD